MDVYQSIVITGGQGMLAHALAQELRTRGLPFVAVSRAECDISQPEAVQSLFQKHRPTLVLNCAAHTRVDQCEDEPQLADVINGQAVGTLAAQARETGARLVHYSTDFVFDGQSDRPYLPTDHPNPLSVYGRSKLLGETRLQEANPSSWLIIRTAWVFGRHGSCFPQTILKLAQAGRPYYSRSSTISGAARTYTVDLAQATLRLVDAKAEGIHHVTNQAPTTWFAFARATLDAFRMRGELSPVTTQEWLHMRPRQAPRPGYSVLDTQSYTAATGHQLRDWREALEDYRTASSDEAEMSPTI